MAEGLQIFDASGNMVLDFTDSITRYFKTEFYDARVGNYQQLKFVIIGPKSNQNRYWALTRMEKVTDVFNVERGPLPAFNVYIGSKQDVLDMNAPIEWKQARTPYMDDTNVYVILSSEIVQQGSSPDKSTIYVDVGMR